MNENRTMKLAEIPIGGKGGAVWNRLHDERENICEALVSEPASYTHERGVLLQARLRRLDDALDRLMSGSYGICSNCGHSIEDAALAIDPAGAFCRDCWRREPGVRPAGKNEDELTEGESNSRVILDSLNAFDTILVHTHNSDYRILLLDPGTGRALVEGGSYFPEPSEGLVTGSVRPGTAFDGGAICVGSRLEMWVDGKALLTSSVEAVEVKANAAAESPAVIAAALHGRVA